MSDEELIKETMMLDYSQLVIHNVYMIKENKRLNNIINELEECIESAYNWEGVDFTIKRNGKPEIVYDIEEVKQWIKELKGSDKE